MTRGKRDEQIVIIRGVRRIARSILRKKYFGSYGLRQEVVTWVTLEPAPVRPDDQKEKEESY